MTRVAAPRTPVALTVVRHRAQPAAVTIIRLTSTAIFAYLLALALTTTPRPVLAPLTALLVVRVSLYETLRSAVTKVASVVAGVLLAVALSAWVGFTWWSLAITIAIGLGVGYALHLGDNILEVPISAMLILSVGTRNAAVGRVVETFVGTGAGLIAGFVLTSPQVETAEEAIEDLCGKLAGLLDRMAAGLAAGTTARSAGEWLAQARSLGSEIRRVDEALRQGLETLEHETTTVRVLCRSVTDCTRLPASENPLNDPDACRGLAAALRELAAAIKVYGSLATEHDVSAHQRVEAQLEQHLAAMREQQNQLGERLRADPAARAAGWPLGGELISHLDRLRHELQTGKPEPRARRRKPRRRGRTRNVLRRRLSLTIHLLGRSSSGRRYGGGLVPTDPSARRAAAPDVMAR
ncbi:MAG TPA: aromatic acid exporter family protein [Streptosporangiaceae bacterium]|jgi:hypothetical protein